MNDKRLDHLQESVRDSTGRILDCSTGNSAPDCPVRSSWNKTPSVECHRRVRPVRRSWCWRPHQPRKYLLLGEYLLRRHCRWKSYLRRPSLTLSSPSTPAPQERFRVPLFSADSIKTVLLSIHFSDFYTFVPSIDIISKNLCISFLFLWFEQRNETSRLHFWGFFFFFTRERNGINYSIKTRRFAEVKVDAICRGTCVCVVDYGCQGLADFPRGHIDCFFHFILSTMQYCILQRDFFSIWFFIISQLGFSSGKA